MSKRGAPEAQTSRGSYATWGGVHNQGPQPRPKYNMILDIRTAKNGGPSYWKRPYIYIYVYIYMYICVLGGIHLEHPMYTYYKGSYGHHYLVGSRVETGVDGWSWRMLVSR